MAHVSHDVLLELAAATPDPGVSIYLCAGPRSCIDREPRVRLKNLVKDAYARLLERGMRAADARNMLEPARELDRDPAFWREPPAGVALFLSPEESRVVHLARSFADCVFVDEAYLVTPLLCELNSTVRFYLLTLSQNRVGLYVGDDEGLSPIHVQNLPNNAGEALRYDQFERQLQFHFGGGKQRRGKSIPVYHGMGAGEDGKKTPIERFVQVIAGVIDAHLIRLPQHEAHQGTRQISRKELPQAPLVLAGVDYLCSLYRSTSRYEHIPARTISGNPEIRKSDELYRSAFEIAREWYEEQTAPARERFLADLASGRAISKLEDIEAALRDGAVEDIAVASSGCLVENEIQRASTDELASVNTVVIHAVEQGVPVHILRSEDLPQGILVIARRRAYARERSSA